MLFGKKRIRRLVDGAQSYINENLERPKSSGVRYSISDIEYSTDIRYSRMDSVPRKDVKYSLNDKDFLLEKKKEAEKQAEKPSEPQSEQVTPAVQLQSESVDAQHTPTDTGKQPEQEPVKQLEPTGKDTYNEEAVHAALRSIPSASPQAVMRTISKNIDKSFVDEMIEIIDRQHMKDSDVYKAAQIDRRLFSKIVSDRSYKPAKDTCIALALALRLTKLGVRDFLSRAGYTLSYSDKRDVVIEYFFSEQIYKLRDVNEVLYQLGLKTLGR